MEKKGKCWLPVFSAFSIVFPKVFLFRVFTTQYCMVKGKKAIYDLFLHYLLLFVEPVPSQRHIVQYWYNFYTADLTEQEVCE